jgi:transcriptional regulator with XRE-family HTH domain
MTESLAQEILPRASISTARGQKVSSGALEKAWVFFGAVVKPKGGGRGMPDKPYAERGERLRARRKELQKAGRLPSTLDKLAERAGITRGALQQWERGETWPTAKNKAKLLPLLDWTEQELDHGPLAGERSDNMGYHPVGPVELELLALFRALGTEQQEFIHKLKARVAARQTLGQQVKGELNTIPDAQVRKQMPVTEKARRQSKPAR